jgi:hypothetical protein
MRTITGRLTAPDKHAIYAPHTSKGLAALRLAAQRRTE